MAATPGPSIAALVSRVITSGVRDVLPFLAAMWIGEALWLTAAATGLSAVARAFNTGFEIAKCAGVAYLLYLAWKMWTAPTTFEQGVLPLRQHPLKMFGAGIAVTLGNPKIMLFYVALLPTVINVQRVSVAGWALLAITLILELALIDLTWSLVASQARRLITSRRAAKIANRSSAVTMAGAAAAIATR